MSGKRRSAKRADEPAIGGLSSCETNISSSEKKSDKVKFNRMSWSRYELKYHITESQAAGIVEYIKPFMHMDKYCTHQRSGYYPNVSLYLDSPDAHLCRESLTGIKNRFKLRIRSYTDELEYPRFLEIKRRVNTIIIKSRAKIMDHDVANVLAGHPASFIYDSKEADTISQFQLYMNSIQAKPIVLVRYLRQAFEDNFHNRLRVTFDRELVYKITNRPKVRMGGQSWQQNSFTRRGVILEIKFTNYYPIWLTRMARLFNLRQRSISKFVTSVQESCLLKYCAPRMEYVNNG